MLHKQIIHGLDQKVCDGCLPPFRQIFKALVRLYIEPQLKSSPTFLHTNSFQVGALLGVCAMYQIQLRMPGN